MRLICDDDDDGPVDGFVVLGPCDEIDYAAAIEVGMKVAIVVAYSYPLME